MSYIEKTLLPGETVVYRTGRHWIVLVFPFAVAIFFSVFLLARLASARSYQIGAATIAIIVYVAIPLLVAFFRLRAVEFAVTNQRVIAKKGILRTISTETPHDKVASIHVDQSLLGKMLDYGTIEIRGTGGTPEGFKMIKSPLDLRRQIQTALEADRHQSRLVTNAT